MQCTQCGIDGDCSRRCLEYCLKAQAPIDQSLSVAGVHRDVKLHVIISIIFTFRTYCPLEVKFVLNIKSIFVLTNKQPVYIASEKQSRKFLS